MTQPRNERTGGVDARPSGQSWWRRIQWIDVVFVIVGLSILLMLTAELWLPHYLLGSE